MRRYFLSIWASGESGKSHGFVDADPTDLRGGVPQRVEVHMMTQMMQ